jgi:hypothetical protein
VRRLLDRRLQVVLAVEGAQVVQGGSDRHLVLVLRRQRRDRPSEVLDAVGVVAVALERRRVAARILAPSVEDLIDQRMASERRHETR